MHIFIQSAAYDRSSPLKSYEDESDAASNAAVTVRLKFSLAYDKFKFVHRNSLAL
jgi:hypothetical protein